MLTRNVNTRDGDTVLFPGKIAVVTNLPFQTQSEDEFWSAEQLVLKYGSEKVMHLNWPSFYTDDEERMDDIVATLAVDREISAVIMNQAITGCNAAVDRLVKSREDIFIIYCTPHESPLDSAARANLVFNVNGFDMGSAMVKQAKKQGAKTFVHYSFSRHMSQAILSGHRDMVRKTCAAEGLCFVGATAIDPKDDRDGAHQFILDDIPKLIAEYGEDTAFFCTNCSLQAPLIRAVMDNHAIYPQPCCPSPYHGIPEALGIETGDGLPDVNYVIGESKRIIAGKNMTGRLSTWPVPLSMMYTHAGVDYAIKWINGQAPKTGIDDKVLMDCMKSYIKEVSGEDIGVFMTSYSEQGATCDNFKLLLMDYLDY